MNPDVAIPFNLIETWDNNYFSVPAHIKSEYSNLAGERVGKALSKIITEKN